MNTLTEIYEVLKEEGLCLTRADFSRSWLGRSAHYMSQIGGDPERASLTSLQLLACRLKLTLASLCPSTNAESYYKIRSAALSAATIFNGVYEKRHLPKQKWAIFVN